MLVGTVARGSWEGPEAPLSSATSETSLQSWVQDVGRTFLPTPPPPGVQDFQQSEAATDTPYLPSGLMGKQISSTGEN